MLSKQSETECGAAEIDSSGCSLGWDAVLVKYEIVRCKFPGKRLRFG